MAWREMCDSVYSGYDELGRTRNNRISQENTWQYVGNLLLPIVFERLNHVGLGHGYQKSP